MEDFEEGAYQHSAGAAKTFHQVRVRAKTALLSQYLDCREAAHKPLHIEAISQNGYKKIAKKMV